ncbi:MAG: glutathionylspermidine synthase family protein [Sphingomonadales bacterium]|nr:glutathionylspermidine synthase family protein [Sphingomonadales bacterium]
MRRLPLAPRPDWQSKVEGLGLLWHSADGRPYWSESACYAFTAAEVDRIAHASEELCRLFVAAGDYVIQQRLYADFGIPDWCAPLIERAWEQEPPALNHGRFDLGMTADGDIKLFEFNCDTPTSLVEAAVVQWFWKEEVFPQNDQFNAIHEALVERWRAIAPSLPGQTVHFAHVPDRLGEDTLTTAYMMDLATEAGLTLVRLAMRDIGWKDGPEGGFFDMDSRRIDTLFKLYPWEWLVAEPFGRHIAEDPRATVWLEPVWKLIWSNKAILPVLWRLFPGHPNLLWSGHQPPANRTYVRKPIHGREGGNVTVVRNGEVLAETGGPYTGPAIFQSFIDMPAFDGAWPIIGSWVADATAIGMGIREGGRITANGDRFVPHIIEG